MFGSVKSGYRSNKRKSVKISDSKQSSVSSRSGHNMFETVRTEHQNKIEVKNKEMMSMYTRIRQSVKEQSVLTRGNIIDLVDTIVRRARIQTTSKQLLNNFLLENVWCCRRRCLLRNQRSMKE